jgi:hypothetical protein
MNRIIKFRGSRIDTNELVYDHYIEHFLTKGVVCIANTEDGRVYPCTNGGGFCLQNDQPNGADRLHPMRVKYLTVVKQ